MGQAVTIVIPFGTSQERPYIDERVKNKVYELKGINDIEVIFVEGFSSKPNPDLKEIIEQNGHIYYKDIEQTRFSQGMCRNLGASYSSCNVCTFLDVDYYISKISIKKLLQLIEVKQIDKNPNRFLILPCVFLTENGSNYLLNQDREKWDTLVQYDVISEKKNLSRFLALSSSSVVMNRHKFLELGGNDKTYIGHGYEDFDFSMRLFKSCGNIEYMPKSIQFDARSWTFTDYKGFRALLSVPGFEALFYGIYLYHFYHIEPNNNGYNDNKEINHQKFYSRIEKYKIMADGPDPLLHFTAFQKKCLIFTKENSSPYRSLRGVIPYIGNLICKDEDSFFENEKLDKVFFEKYLQKNRIDTIIFPNPYGNEKRLEIYNYVRTAGLSYLCYDRGALPDSWFLDSKGFNYDSGSYSEDIWNKELTNEQIDIVNNYIEQIKKSDNFLESQGSKIDNYELKKKLGIRNKKIVFIPLQVEDDTVIKYFTEHPFDYYGFAQIANNAAIKLEKEDWVFVAKQHPLMKNFNKSQYPNLIFVPDDTNINTLLDMCDIVLTINSGVGVYAMIFEKPCIITGNAFYQFNGINTRVYSEDEIIEYIRNEDFQFDKYKMTKFIYYLYQNFYSYGKSYYKSKDENNRIRRIVNYIDFYRIIINGNTFLDANDITKLKYKKDTLSLRPYISDIQKKTENNELKSPAKISQKKNIIKNQNIKKEVQSSKIKRKIRKLFRNPKLFFVDMLKNRPK